MVDELVVGGVLVVDGLVVGGTAVGEWAGNRWGWLWLKLV